MTYPVLPKYFGTTEQISERPADKLTCVVHSTRMLIKAALQILIRIFSFALPAGCKEIVYKLLLDRRV